jgi:hypothetical protein
MLILDKVIRGFFEASVVAFALVAILSTVSAVTISDEEDMFVDASITDNADASPTSEIVWRQIDDVMVPVELVEFPPFYISARPNMLYINQE